MRSCDGGGRRKAQAAARSTKRTGIALRCRMPDQSVLSHYWQTGTMNAQRLALAAVDLTK